MEKIIIPHKLIINLNKDGTFRDGILQYQIQEDGVIDNGRFYTIGIKDAINIPDIETIIGDTTIQAQLAEKIILVKPIRGEINA